MTMSECYSYAAGITSLIIAICYGIYWLIRYVMASKRSLSQSPDYDLESQSDDVSAEESEYTLSSLEGELLAEASAQSLLLDMAAIEAANRMNAVASECKDETF